MIDRQRLKDVLIALEETFQACNIDHYLIGALARDVWFHKAGKKFRSTKDIDLAVLVGSNDQYEQVCQYLIRHKNYVSSTTNAFVVIAPDKTQIDLLPFGALAIEEGTFLLGDGLTSIKVNGFMEVYKEGTEEAEIIEGHRFQIAKLPAIVLLKFIAYDDRSEQRINDATDIANIINEYFDMEAALIYDNHSDLFAADQPDRPLEELAAIVIGREIYQILKSNDQLYQRLSNVIQRHIEKGEKNEFVKQMARETGKTIEEMIGCLKGLRSGLSHVPGSDA